MEPALRTAFELVHDAAALVEASANEQNLLVEAFLVGKTTDDINALVSVLLGWSLGNFDHIAHLQGVGLLQAIDNYRMFIGHEEAMGIDDQEEQE